MAKKFFHKTGEIDDKPVIIVAGGAGFIGSFLCELLLQQNCRVICLDKLITGSKKNLENCLNNPNFLFIKQDLNQPLSQTLVDPNYIFHLAGLEVYISGDDLSLETFLANVAGTINLLKLTEKTGAKFLLGSSPKVFQAKVATKELADYFGKGPSGESASFSEAKRSAEALTTEYMEQKKIDARIVRMNWVYGPRMDFRTGGVLTRIIKQAVGGGPIEIPGDGSQKIRPLFIGDVVYGLTKAMFGSGTSGKIYHLINPREETILSFAHRLQGILGKGIEIKFVTEKAIPVFDQELDLSSQENLNWHPQIELDEGLERTLEYFQKKIKKPVKKKALLGKKQEKIAKKERSYLGRRNKFLFGLVSVLLIALFYLPGALAINTLLGIKNLQVAYRAALDGNFSRMSFSAKAAETSFNRAQGNLYLLGPALGLLRQNTVQNNIEAYLNIGLQTGKGVEKLGEVAQNIGKISQAIFQNQPADISYLSSAINTDLETVYQHFSYLEGQIKTSPASRQILVKLNGRLIENLSKLRELILHAKEGVLFLPDLTGIYGKRTYLVLFQNNMELRPTGGFIGSFALVTFEGGRLIDFQVLDVYSADGQLKGHVEPPEEIRRYLGEAGWYLRDSNFHPDFPISARRASWFLEKELGKKVNGVVGINLFLAQRILRAVGSVNLVDYQEEINADNLFERAEYHSEIGFFPGSTQKKDFLGALADALFEKVRQADEKQWLAFGQAFYQSLKSKDLLIYLNNQEAAKIMAESGWDGSLRRVNCGETEGECLVDYLMIVESNFGVNKANYFVKRGLNHQISFDSEGKVKETLRIDYHNQSQSEAFPTGIYKNYLRILTPAGTSLIKVAIGGKEIDEKKVDVKEIEDKTSFGFLVEVPIQTQKTVEISYQLAEKLAAGKRNHYLLYLQKQSGIEDEFFNLWLTPYKGMEVVSTSPKASLATNLVAFAPRFDQDLIFEVSF